VIGFRFVTEEKEDFEEGGRKGMRGKGWERWVDTKNTPDKAGGAVGGGNKGKEGVCRLHRKVAKLG
jgi:hypothetical protein